MHLQSTVFVENYIFADNKTVQTVILQLHYYEALELPHKVSLFFWYIAAIPLLSNPIMLPSTLRLIKLLILPWSLIL